MGLHCDGKRLGLSPFQSEIRRRLWWHLLSRDGRAGEDYGLENTNNLLLESSVSLPANIDDTDLYPEMESPPASKTGCTEMTFSLITIDLARVMQRLAAAATASPSPLATPPSEELRAEIIEEARIRIEQWVGCCNPVIPRHRLTLLCSRFLLRKLDFMTRLQWTLLHPTSPKTDFVTEQNLIEALQILEPRLYSEEEGLLKQFAWVKKAFPQYHVTLYILWHLCVNPEGPSIGRAWEVVNAFFSDTLCDRDSTIGFGSKLAVLTALKAKAISVREGIRGHNLGDCSRTTDSDLGLMSEGSVSESECLSTNQLESMGGNELGIHIGNDEDWLNWEILAQSFQFDSLNRIGL